MEINNATDRLKALRNAAVRLGELTEGKEKKVGEETEEKKGRKNRDGESWKAEKGEEEEGD